MNLTRTATLLMLGVATLAAPLASQAATTTPMTSLHPYNVEQTFIVEVDKMADKNGMVSKKDFMKMMSKRFDTMDTGKQGMLTKEQLMRIFSDTTGS